MDDSDRESAFLGALGNEYFVLQSAASTTVSESSTRASLYVFSLSSTLVAVGFVSQTERAFGPFLAVVLPTLFLLGVFSTVRLVDTGVQNVSYLRAMARIRRYWAELTPDAPAFFGTSDDDTHAALASLAVSYGPAAELFTIASMIGAVNSVVGGTGVALLAAHLRGDAGPGLALPVAAGIGAGLVVFAVFLVYQHRRYQPLAETG
ncbi:MAG: hypothetical protein ACRDY6_18905 [Acidimicrobiia bacterium]